MALLNSEVRNSLVFYLFWLVSAVEIGAEFYQNQAIIYATKPLLLPLLAYFYFVTTSAINKGYLVALLFNWLANLAFIFPSSTFLFFATLCFIIHRSIIVFEIWKFEFSRGIRLKPVLMGSAPFLILFLSVIHLVYTDVFEYELYMLIAQAFVMALLGGIAFGAYFLIHDNASKLLFMSALCFALNLFVLGVKLYYLNIDYLKPISMIFFLLGHVFLCKYMVLISDILVKKSTIKDIYYKK